jgi:thymidylate kinase
MEIEALARMIDAAAPERVLVFGSLPPAARDLDLLARVPAREALAPALREAGFAGGGVEWVRFGGCSAQAADLVPAEDWGLSGAELERLYDEAVTLEGYDRLVRPAPHHALLILARRVTHGNGRVTDKFRARIAAALDEDAAAWGRAARAAPEWGAAAALAALREAYVSNGHIGRPARVAAVAEHRRAAGAGRARAVARAVAHARPRRRRGALITFSGLDGSGKSTQAESLVQALERLGHPAAVEWMSLIANPALGPAARPVKRALAFVARLRPGLDRSAERPRDAAPTSRADFGTLVRERSALVTFGWTTIAALAGGWHQRRATRAHLRAGRVVVGDRYTLDTQVHFRYRYGEGRRYRFQTALVRLLSPTPTRSYFLEVAPATALSRKREYEPEQVERRARLYREEFERFGARRLDGERPAEEICAEVARDVRELLG